MKVELKGVIRGVFSENQKWYPTEPAVLTFDGNDLQEVVDGLVLPEWIYTLRVNGRRIVNPESYLKRKGIWNLCIREA